MIAGQSDVVCTYSVVILLGKELLGLLWRFKIILPSSLLQDKTFQGVAVNTAQCWCRQSTGIASCVWQTLQHFAFREVW
jgi:hypothetical protein